MLAARDQECAWRAAQERARRRPQGAERDHPGRGPHPRRAGHRRVRRRLWRQVAQGGRQGHWRDRAAAVLLRLPRRALGAPADHQPDRELVLAGQGQTRVTKGPGTRDTGLAMVFKLLEAAEGRWRAVNGPTWSPWCGPARGSRPASSSNDPTRPRTRRPTRTSPRSPRDHALTGDPQNLTIPRWWWSTAIFVVESR